ncbi:MAG TPA: hypothetical protein DDZ53_03875 [Firmicutes bacterium]|nr:hypothetical protein [Bacillota bacterium]
MAFGSGSGERRRIRSCLGGFTLVELLVCLAIMGLLAGIAAAPAFGKQRARQLLSATVMNLSNDLRAARFSAMEEGRCYCVEVFAGNYTITAEAPVRWELIKRVDWPSGIRRSGTLYVKLYFPATGLFHELDNNSIYLKDSYGRISGVVISSGGRIRIGQP